MRLVAQITINRLAFIRNHLMLPLVAFSVIVFCMEMTQIDVWLAGRFYNAELKLWPYREHWLTQTVLHKGGRYFVYVVGIGLLLFCLASYRSKSKLYVYRRHLTYLVLASLAGPLFITYLKSHTHIYCPWDVVMFGGSKPHVKLFDPVDNTFSVGHCFPSGHSGLGFTFVSVYFFFLVVKPEYRYYGLLAGLVTGFIFGVNQEIRGAHFFSHDVFSLAICWFSSLILFVVYYRKQLT
jgi:membrane-associated PAP2 superfamily phosphatase